MRTTKSHDARVRAISPGSFPRIHDLAQFRSLPLRAEHALFGAKTARRRDAVVARAHLARAVETHVDGEKAGCRALENDLLRRSHHRQSALGVAEQVLRRHDDGEILDRARPDEVAPGGPQFAL